MKKLLYFAIFAFALAFSSCEKIDIPEGDPTDTNDVNPPSANLLLGTWVMNGEDYSITFTFTENTWTSAEGDYVEQGTYSLNGDVLTMNIGDSVANQVRVIMLYGNNVLVMRFRSDFGGGWGIADEFALYYRQGSTVDAPLSDIQGKWFWYYMGESTIIRASLEITDNNFEFIIPIWRERMQGTLEYVNGMIRFHVNEFWVRDNLEEGNESLENLYLYWRHPDPEQWDRDEPTFGMNFERPFVANGNEAFCVFANLPAYFEKQ